MKKNTKNIRNALVAARIRWGISRKTAARILQQDVRTLAAIEQGYWSPPLALALELEILYRVPVAFLYPTLYSKLRRTLRARELRTKKDNAEYYTPLNPKKNKHLTNDPWISERHGGALQLHRELFPSSEPTSQQATLW